MHEAERIKGLVCFHHELVDKILVDGVEIPKEATAASDGYF
ncbi:msl7335 [Mesorhizobium japonicum MAFF 303099]|uniref:Msl7335 protein n=1 Tax=Mesorhizobium japonicum (strain LMG 29417 / CECT 9101 / MAFF 303099) TaxID=266835 RepID=Q986J0_RHILO|nr:msl7335 [Mesorhizobium japonicum MAFF 303099]